MRALLCDGIDGSAVNALTQAGFEVTSVREMKLDQLQAAVSQYHFLAVRSATRVPAEVLVAGKNLLAVGRGGAGIDSIDFKKAAELGIVVFATPGANASSVAECAVAKILDALHLLSKGAIGMAKYHWLKKDCQGQSLRGKTVGIVGMGYVGKWLARLLEPFGVSLLSFDTNPASVLPWVPLVPLEQLLAASDVVSLNLSLTSGSKGMVNRDFITKMRNGAALVNLARGGLINEVAVMEALCSGKLGCYAADVYSEEPPDFTASPLFQEPELVEAGRLILTPHVAASSQDAQADVADMLVQQTLRYFQKGEMPWGANFPVFYLERQGDSRLIVFHLDTKGKIADILSVVRQFANVAGNLNQRVYQDGPAYTVIDVDGGINSAMIEQIKEIPDVFRVHCVS